MCHMRARTHTHQPLAANTFTKQPYVIAEQLYVVPGGESIHPEGMGRGVVLFCLAIVLFFFAGLCGLQLGLSLPKAAVTKGGGAS